ncbi:MAG: hypothetical protein N3B21_19255 [Clostridia bacterium]|nr:hypothetical protein [Clostridia bacterium]
MRALLVYNKEDARERELVERAINEMSSVLTDVEMADFNEIRQYIPISFTPCLILVHEDLQGGHLLEEDMDNNHLRVTAELLKAMDDEESVVHNAEVFRIDRLVKNSTNLEFGQQYNVAHELSDLILEGSWDSMTVDDRKIRVWKWMVQEGKISINDIPQEHRAAVQACELPVLNPNAKLAAEIKATADAVDFILLNFVPLV